MAIQTSAPSIQSTSQSEVDDWISTIHCGEFCHICGCCSLIHLLCSCRVHADWTPQQRRCNWCPQGKSICVSERGFSLSNRNLGQSWRTQAGHWKGLIHLTYSLITVVFELWLVCGEQETKLRNLTELAATNASIRSMASDQVMHRCCDQKCVRFNGCVYLFNHRWQCAVRILRNTESIFTGNVLYEYIPTLTFHRWHCTFDIEFAATLLHWREMNFPILKWVGSSEIINTMNTKIMIFSFQSLLASVSKPTKLMLGKVGMFSVSALNAIVSSSC